jgi:hypothetical protein
MTKRIDEDNETRGPFSDPEIPAEHPLLDEDPDLDDDEDEADEVEKDDASLDEG